MEALFAKDNFSYTLLGSKPISWATYHVPFPYKNWSTFFNTFNKYNRRLRMGWQTWQKYQHKFPSTCFFSESPKSHPGSRSILLVNEKQFNLVVLNNKNDFEKVLDKEVKNGFQLLKEAENSTLMNGVLKGHQALIGIALGYGRENSWQFLEQSEKKETLGWIWNKEEYWGEQDSPQYDSLLEYYLNLYSCPSFAGIPNSDESLALKSDYLQTKQKILDYYKDQDFLEAVLSLLAGFRPE